MDLLRSASLLAQGAPSLIPKNLPSPFRMTFINPRRFFNAGSEIDWVKLITKSVAAATTEWLANLSTLNSSLDIGGMSTVVSDLANSLITGSDGSIYIFYINPKTVNVSHQKIVNEVLTGSGWDYDVLGDQISSYDFAGTSGNMIATIPFTDILSIRLSRAFLKFVIFEQFYLYNNNDPLILIFDHMAYIGKLAGMNWSWDADDIYQIKYNFSWRCDPLFSFEPITGAGVTSLFDRADLINTMFNPSLKHDLFLTREGNIDVYEQGVKLYSNESTSLLSNLL